MKRLRDFKTKYGIGLLLLGLVLYIAAMIVWNVLELELYRLLLLAAVLSAMIGLLFLAVRKPNLECPHCGARYYGRTVGRRTRDGIFRCPNCGAMIKN